MPPGMPHNSVMHIRRNLSPCLLHMPGELRDAGNCSQLVGSLLQNRPEVFSRNCLCAVPRSNISHPEKQEVVATPILRLFGRAQGISTGHEDSLLASGKIVRVVTSRHITVTSVTCRGQGNSKHVIFCLGRRPRGIKMAYHPKESGGISSFSVIAQKYS